MELPSVVTNGLTLFLLWLFVSAAVEKLRPANLDYYQDIIANYGVRLPELARMLVFLLGVSELVIGIALLIPAIQSIAAIAGAALLGIYLIAMWRQLAQGRADMDCGCSGPAASVKISAALLWRNLFYIAALIGCAYFSVEPTYSWSFWTLSLLLAVVLITIALSAEQLISSEQRLRRLKEVMS